MNIFDPHISGSLTVSGSGQISGDLTVLGTINATISGTTSNAITASEAPKYTLTSSFGEFTSSYTTGSFTGSFDGTLNGDGSGLFNIPASGVTGLNLDKIISGSVSASISPNNGFEVNTNTTVSGHITPSVDNEYDLGSPTHQWRDVYISSGSLYIDGSKVLSSTTQELTITTDNGQSLKILEGTTDSIVLQTADGNIELKSSADGDILIDPTNGKILLKGPVEILSGQKIQSSVGGTPVVFANDIVVSGSIDLTGTIDGIDLSSFSSSVDNRFINIESAASSLNTFTSSIDTTIKSKLDGEGVVSGSSQIILSGTTGFSTVSASLSSLSSSISITNLNQDSRLNSIETNTGSYAITGSNTFVGSQIISGSVTIRENLIVLGSSSITYTTSSQLRVDDNVIVVNTSTPAERFGGLQVYDSGSVGESTGSLFWDGEKNRWVYQNTSEASYSGGVLMSGPRSSGSLGDELTLTSGKIARSAGGDHLNDSIITEYGGTTIGIAGNLEISGSLIIPSTPLVSGSSQISFNGITDKPTLVSGSSQITYSSISSIPSGIVSGSSQIIYSSISGIPSGIVSGSSQIVYSSISSIPGGIVSGSSQIDLTATTNYSSGIKTRLNAEGVISGSSQVSFGSITGVPTGLVSGSSQITLTSTQVTNGLGYTPYNSTNPNGYITGVSFANVSSKPTTLSGYGITDSIKSNGTLNGNIDSDWGESFTTFDPIPSGTPPLQSPNIRTINIGANYSRRTQLAFDYASDLAYFRRRQDSSWGSWREFIHSGNIGSQSVSYASTAGNITAYTINQNLGTSNSVKFGAFVDVNSSSSAFRFYDGSTFRGGIGLDDWAHGGSAANVTVYASGVLHFTSGATKRAYFNTSGHFLPEANASYDLGATGNRWRTIYTSDLSLSNGIGDYTIVEGEEKLYLYNNKNNKVYSFVLQEEDPKTATPKLPQ